MSYQLGIDLGTTYTAAAISRATERAPAGVDVVTLGARSATVASVMYLADDGSVLVGEAAERRALTDPDRVVREFKRRIGDDVPLMIGGRQFQAHQLGARMVRWVVDQVSEREGGPPRRIAVTHPASWGSHKKDLLGSALRDIGVAVTFLAEPQAAAVSYASAERVDPGSTVAVYDLGGGTFDAAVVRKTPNGGFELLGQPEGLERLGGVDFDEVVFGFVRDSLGGQLDGLNPEDPDVLSAVARLRRECVEAKEALSSDTEATIPVLLPELRTQARITRGEFEAMIRPALEETIVALRRAVGSAGLAPPDLNAVLLVGGSSRIPLVSQMVSDELGRPVAVDADPKTAIAMGAALAISPQAPAPARPPAPHGTGAMPPVGGMGPAGMAAGAAGAAAGYAARQPPPPPPPGHGGPGGPGGPGGSGGLPPRPPMGSEPPRPDVAPAAFGGGNFDDGHFAEPARRSQRGMLIGVGGVVAIGAILAAVFWWPSSSNDTTGAGNSTNLAPSNSAPVATGKAAPSKGSGGTKSTPKTTPKAPTSTTVNHPPSTEKAPSSSAEEPPEESHSSKPSSHQPASSGNKPAGKQNGAGESPQNTPGASAPTEDPGFGGEPAAPQATVPSPYTAPTGLGPDSPSGDPAAGGGAAPAGQSWGQYAAGSRSMA